MGKWAANARGGRAALVKVGGGQVALRPKVKRGEKQRWLGARNRQRPANILAESRRVAR